MINPTPASLLVELQRLMPRARWCQDQHRPNMLRGIMDPSKPDSNRYDTVQLRLGGKSAAEDSAIELGMFFDNYEVYDGPVPRKAEAVAVWVKGLLDEQAKLLTDTGVAMTAALAPHTETPP